MKKMGAVLAIGAGILMIAGACIFVDNLPRQQEANVEENEHEKEEVTLDWYVNYSWFVTQWGDNVVSEAITEKTGVRVNFVTPIGSELEKLNSLISSDSLPDIITLGWWEPQVDLMINEEMVYALNELADEYYPYFHQVADEQIVNWYTKEDGNIYGYPSSSYTPQDLEEYDNIPANQTFLVRKDIYEAIGSPDMTTTEGFYNAIKKAAAMFPEIDGEQLIPIGAHIFDEHGCVSFDQYLQNFLAVPYEVDGEYYDRSTDPEYLRWLKMFRRLGEEGYLKNDIFVDQRTQMSEKLAQGRYFCMLYQRTDMADQQKILYQKNPDSIYIAVDGPRNLAGDAPTLPSSGIYGWTVTLVSKNCKDPQKAIELITFLISEEGQKLTSIGVEGVTYDIVNGEVVLKDEVQKLLNSDREAYDLKYGADNAYWMLQDNVMQLQWMPEAKEPLRQMAEWTYPYTMYLGQYEVTMKEDSEEGVAYENTNRLWGATLRRLLLAKSDAEFDKIVEEYKAERETLGYDLVCKERTRQIKMNKERLGIQ